MADLIDRQEAINALRKLAHELVMIDKVCSLGVATEFIDELRNVPRAEQTEPKTDCCETCKHKDDGWDSEACDPCSRANSNYEPEPNNCETCKHYDAEVESIACERCLEGKYSRYEPKDEPQYHADIECNYKDCENCEHQSYCPQREDEPQADDLIRQADEMIKFDKELLRMDEEQTDRPWK